MNCEQLQNDSPFWLPCTDPSISSTPFCQNLPPNLFDIEVLGEIQQFEGSTAGTTIQNFQTDTFRVNEIVNRTHNTNQLGGSLNNDFCIGLGFEGGASLFNSNSATSYNAICFEYEDEQGNDCNPITIRAGEEKTCTVKNHIAFAQQFNPAQQTVTSNAAFQQQSEDSPIISQGIKGSPTISQEIGNSPKLTGLEKQSEESSELTALEKVEKLKQQWMELYQ